MERQHRNISYLLNVYPSCDRIQIMIAHVHEKQAILVMGTYLVSRKHNHTLPYILLSIKLYRTNFKWLGGER